MDKPKCVICNQYLDKMKDNYGWHVGKDANIEKCDFKNISLNWKMGLVVPSLEPHKKRKLLWL